MTITKYASLLSTLFVLAAPFPASANITVDGYLNDWIKAPTGVAGDWSNTQRDSIAVSSADQGNGSYLGPGSGGQAYDAEAMYLELNGSTLNIAIVTGLAPPNLDSRAFPAGDILFGFEKSDGSSVISYEYALTVLDHYNTTSAYDHKHNSNLNAGSGETFGDFKAGELVAATSFDYGIFRDNGNHISYDAYQSNRVAYGDPNHPTLVTSGTSKASLGNGISLSYGYARYDDGAPGTTNAEILYDDEIGGIKSTGDYGGYKYHYLIEASIDLSDTSVGSYGEKFMTAINGGALNVHWAPTCNNDNIQLTNFSSSVSPPSVPEPASLALFALGFIGIVALRRKTKANVLVA
jgi:hypothetical protein